MAAEFQGRVKQLQENWMLACFGLRGSCLSGMKMKLLWWPRGRGSSVDCADVRLLWWSCSVNKLRLGVALLTKEDQAVDESWRG